MSDNSSQSQNGANSGSGVALPVGLELGHYRLLRKIGQGGFGITYLAEHMQSHEQVVIKENLPTYYAYRDITTMQVHPLDDTDSAENYAHALQRFVDEARTLAHLNHPNIVRVHEAFEALGTAYFVMPYIDGKELHKAAPAKPDEAWLLPILKTVLKALDYLHSQNLLHRDLKPGNILLQEDGTPILIDFGTARALHTERSATMVGTPGYTPIEQITTHGKRGPWTDIYALGATCYRLITGERPPEAFNRVEGEDPYIPLAPREDLYERFSYVLLQSIDTALAIRPKNRWQNAQEWLDELPVSATGPAPAIAVQISTVVAASAETPEAPAPKPALPQKGKSTGRALTLALLLALLGGGGYAGYTYLQVAEQELTQAEYALSESQRLNRELDERRGRDNAERLAHEQAMRAEAERRAQEKAAREEAARKAKKQAAKEETARLAREQEEREEAERLASERLEKEKAQRLARIEAERKLRAMGITDYDEAICEAYNNPNMLKLLIAVGADVNRYKENEGTPLYRATCEGLTECVKILLSAPDIDVNKEYRKYYYSGAHEVSATPIDMATYEGHTQCLKLLLAAPGIGSNAVNTALINAAARGKSECLKLLLAAPSIDINKVDEALICAAENGHAACVKLLLDVPGININKTNEAGKSPLSVATPECAKLIRAAGKKNK